MSAPKNRKATPRRILAAQAAQLRAEGLSPPRIAVRLGVSKSYAYELITDPTGDIARRRKARYRGTCRECGASTSYVTGGVAELCSRCSLDDRKIWTPDAVVCAIQEWADEHGGIPPVATDWNPHQARGLGKPEKAEKFYRDGCWPTVNTVQDCFGSWNAAIKAAGLEPRRSGEYGRENEGFADRHDIVAMYESGMSADEIAESIGVTSSAVLYQLHRRGARIRSRSEANRLRWRAA